LKRNSTPAQSTLPCLMSNKRKWASHDHGNNSHEAKDQSRNLPKKAGPSKSKHASHSKKPTRLRAWLLQLLPLPSSPILRRLAVTDASLDNDCKNYVVSLLDASKGTKKNVTHGAQASSAAVPPCCYT
jgi:hypothetical protein